MTILRTNRYALNVPTLVEDPTPGSNLLFIQNEAYDKTSLNQNFAKTISYNVAGTGYSTFGTSNFTQSAGNTLNPDYWNGVLILNGESTHVKNTLYNTLNDYKNNLDTSPFSSMDPNNRIKGSRYDTYGQGNSTLLWYEMRGSASTYASTTWYHSGTRPAGTDISTYYPAQNGSLATSQTLKPVYLNTYTGNLISIGTYDPTGFCPGGYAGAAITGTNVIAGLPLPITVPIITQLVVGAFATTSCQFIGSSDLTGQGIMLHNNFLNDSGQYIHRYNDTNNTYVTLYANSTPPNGTTSTGGTSWGGDRGTTQGGYIAKFASSTFTDISSSTTQGFFVPYLDILGNYHPHYYRWNKSSDSFTRYSTTSTTYPSGTNLSTYWYPDNLSAGGTASIVYGLQRVWYNETFIYNDVRFLTLMQLHGAGGVFDNVAQYRTFVTYTVVTSVDPNLAYQSLIYHSSVVIPITPKNILWLNDSHTSMGVFATGNFYIYNFNDTTGWTLITTYPYTFTAAGRDANNRIWAYDAGPLGFGRLHLLQGNSTPAKISIVPNTSTFNYSGSTIPIELSVDSFDINGLRQENYVTLTAVGTSMVLLNTGDQTQVKSVTTLTSTLTSVIVQAAIVGPGTTGLEANVLI